MTLRLTPGIHRWNHTTGISLRLESITAGKHILASLPVPDGDAREAAPSARRNQGERRSRRCPTMTSHLTLEPDNVGASPPVALRRIARLMGGVAVTLGIASALHLAGLAHGRSGPFDATHAGIAEAIIGAVLAGGAVAVVRTPDHA